ncbi:hypothetical protein [Mesorhizobium sp.]|jgi:hypothetical protein|uniref:hypothetical protein n=1 Tax=Mesorhizobium sp. TaxID=1871066 RepID=UPI00356A3E2D
MRPADASLVLGLLLCVTLAGKAATLARTPGAAADDGMAAVAFLKTRGLVIQPFDPTGAPAWVVGTRDECTVRIGEVAPEGWSRAIVAQQTVGERLLYAFDGRFYNQQPVTRTWTENYRRRLARYLGFDMPTLRVFAIAAAPACPADLVAGTPFEPALRPPLAPPKR